ncbi:MAG: GGDEF domain-containing protein [Rhodoferax sp.]|nr:GGDEF domain-containing protein [Rhodoferax sp.]MCB2008698.1 GGDEF domain-containing protein [Rhodoferax sp.]MCB2028311.1 GGDEF domain-containing protein [Rhodoferax sp.]MCB2040165.1 GGDEF domain-containing protein [Rhodoferax sp.]MCP5260437.1 GGDEF domain-containing protein [Rhodoferax sp.]
MGTGSPVPFVDPRTIVLLTGVMGGLMAVVLYFLQRNYPPSVKGLRYWTAGTAVLFAAGLTAATRGLTPDVVSIMLANLLIFTGVYLQFFGTEKFFERKTRFWPRYAMICALTLVSGWFTVVNPLYMPRLMISIIVMSALFSAHAWLILRHGGRSFAYRFAVLILVCALLSQVLRFATAWLFPTGTGILDTTPQNLIYMISYPFLMLLSAISLVLMATDRVRAEFEHLASHDSLTNALTRRNLTVACQQELERCRRHGRSMSILLIDIDHFKVINDSFGHQAGDRVLVQFVSGVSTLLRRADVIGRLGGEEFVVLLPETPTEVARVVAERIRAKVRELDSPGQFTVSIGVATNLPDTDSVDSLMARADRAMYKAKEQGRDQVVLG